MRYGTTLVPEARHSHREKMKSSVVRVDANEYYCTNGHTVLPSVTDRDWKNITVESTIRYVCPPVGCVVCHDQYRWLFGIRRILRSVKKYTAPFFRPSSNIRYLKFRAVNNRNNRGT